MNSKVIAAYAAYSKNEAVRMASSSGAVFSILAEMILKEQGVIYGVAMSLDCRSAEYIRVDSKKELSRLRGSKYLQANAGKTYGRVKNDLEKGVLVLYTGTGCQINGLVSYLERNYSNLYCVDVVCHGVPSPALWEKYIDDIENKYKAYVTKVNFRYKEVGAKGTYVKKLDSKNKQVYISKDKNPYMQMFLRDYCLRPSCYKCFAKEEKLSDITIADFWGIGKIMPDMNDGKGVSLVLIRTEQGKKLIKKVWDDLIIKEVEYTEGVKENPSEYSSVVRPIERNTFFEDLRIMSFDEIKRRYLGISPFSVKRVLKRGIRYIFLKISFLNDRSNREKDMRRDPQYGMLLTMRKRDNQN